MAIDVRGVVKITKDIGEVKKAIATGGGGIKINLPKERCLQAAERPDIITQKIGDITNIFGYITNIIGETNVGTASWI